MKKFLHSRDAASKGAALIIVLAIVVLATGLGLAYLTRTTTNRQLAQTSYHDTSADLLARSALDITVSDLKQEIVAHPTATASPPYYIQPARYPSPIPADNPNLIRYSSHNAAASRASNIISTAPSADGRSISKARWNSHYLIPPNNATGTDSTPIGSFVAPDWVLVTAQGPTPFPSPSAVIGRYAFAVYDEGGLVDMNLGGYPNYASLGQPTLPTGPARKLRPTNPAEESEIMLAAFNPNDPPCQSPKFSPDHTNEKDIVTGVPCSLGPYHTTKPATSFGLIGTLPAGLSLNTTNGNITGIPTIPGSFTVTLTCSNGCAPDGTMTLNMSINGFPLPCTTPWPTNVARKGTWAFADLTALPSTPTAITPTIPIGMMGGFPSPTSINSLMGWRNYATTQQPSSATFNNPSFPRDPNNWGSCDVVAADDLFARYFLGASPPPNTPFTAVSAVSWSPPGAQPRTDQAMMTRQELIKLQRTLDNPSGTFPQSLLQYLGTFSRDTNRPAPDWAQTLATRWDMNNLALAIPDIWITWPGNHGRGHAYGLAKHNTYFLPLFGLQWVNGSKTPPSNGRLTNPNYYGRWKYTHNLNDWPDSPDFFQVINNAMKIGNGGVAPDPKTVFTVGAALIDQYDSDDLFDPDPNDPCGNACGNTITIIDTVGNGNPSDYVYGIESMSFQDPDPSHPNSNGARPGLYCAYPPMSAANYAFLNRRFESVGEFGYAYNPASDPTTRPSRTLDFGSAGSHDKPLLDFFTYNIAESRAGIANLNTRNIPVLASIISGAWVHDPGAEATPPPDPNLNYLVSRTDALTAAQAIVQETTNTPALTRADVSRLAGVAAAALHGVAGAPDDERKQTIARALAEVGQARTWNLMIDVIAQTGNYAPGTQDLTDPTKFIVQGEKRYWLHIALDRDGGAVLGTQLEEVFE